MYMLEEERDFFREQVLKLSHELNGLADENKKLKNKLAEMND